MKNNVWFWLTLMAIGFFALLGVMSFTQIDRDAQKQKYEIECLKSGGKIEMILGNGATCVTK